MENKIKDILKCIGEDCDREGLLETPKRVAKMYKEIFDGYNLWSKDLFKSVFTSNIDEMVVVKDISFYSHCEHHMVPFFGVIHIGYIPNGKVLGLSKFARLIDIYAKRLQIQEELTKQIADDIEKYLNPRGLGVIIEARHLCMEMRGIKKTGSKTITTVFRGIFKEQDRTRGEFLSYVR